MNFINNVPVATASLPDEINNAQARVAQAIRLSSLEQNIEQDLKASLALALGRLQLTRLVEPTILLLHQFVSDAVKALHFTVFKSAVQNDFCISTSGSQRKLEVLYQQELAEHGDRNIAKFCMESGLHIVLTFPVESNSIVSISYPDICEQPIQLHSKLADALGLRFCKTDKADIPGYCAVTLMKHNTKLLEPKLPALLKSKTAQCHLQAIFSRLDYGVVSFASTGAILAASPSILRSLNYDVSVLSIQALAKSIPTHFYNDVIWGLALDDPDGVFGNYRIRVMSAKNSSSSMLFNVSGYRDQDITIHTLWQAVSIDGDGDGDNNLSEGSILNEARIHNITRNYVPQLVEERAREIVRLGGNSLINEECCMAVLFCDIVGFTAYVESNEDEESVIHTLNAILRRISKSVTSHGGFIDKFMGDCIMVLFRDPSDAITAALDMQTHSVDINNLRARAGQAVLQLRVGIHWGKVVIGNVGTAERLDWTTIGDVVNTASRIEHSCQPGAVLISQEMRDVVTRGNHLGFKYGDVFNLQVKGKQKNVPVCYVFSS